MGWWSGAWCGAAIKGALVGFDTEMVDRRHPGTLRTVLMLLTAALLGLGAVLPVADVASSVACPTFRPKVRAGTDADASGVALSSSVLTTVGALGALPRPASVTADLRWAPTEATRYAVTARLVGYRAESDGDIALSLRGSDNKVMLADVPLPSCVAAGSPFRTAVVSVRAQVEALIAGLPVGGQPNVDVRISGVGFFDRTGRAGAATNSVALHPVVSFQTAAPAVAMDRTGGADRYSTAAAVSASTFAPGVPAAFVATGTDFPDALAGSAAAASLGGPVLLTTPTVLPAATATEIQRLAPERIFVLGGAAVVSDEIASQLSAVAPVERLSGSNRFATATAVSARFASPGVTDVFVATGYDFPDGVAGAAAAGSLDVPLLLVATASLPAEVASELSRLDPDRITILGGPSVVSATVATQLAAYAPAVRRISGPDRYATAAAISAAVFGSATRARLATGVTFADALSGAPAAAQAPGPVLLSQPTCLPTSVGIELSRLGVTRVSLLGSTGALNADVAALRPCAAYVRTPYVDAVPLPVGCRTVGPDSAGVKVYLVQRALGLVGHNERYDSATQAAVRSFQASHSLPVTGLVNSATWTALGTGYDFCIDRYTVQPTVSPTAPASAHISALLAQAQAQVGKPYIWGGAGPLGFDCSGLALQGLYAGGRTVPGVNLDLHQTTSFATSRAIYNSTALTHVPLSQRKAGDLVFWYDTVSHMAVYLGNDRIVEAVRPTIRTASLWVHGDPLPTVVRPFP